MKRRLSTTALILFAFASLIAVVIVTQINAATSQRRIDALELLAKQRNQLCQRAEWQLKDIVDGTQRIELHQRLTYHHFNESLLELCVGSPHPVERNAASECWIQTGDPQCYLDVARALLQVYLERPGRNH